MEVKSMKLKGFTQITLGLWLLVSAFFEFAPNSSTWNYFIVGIFVVSASFFLIHGEPQQSWIAGILGFWLIIVAIAPSLMSGIGNYLNNIIVGLLITVTGLTILIYGKKLIRHVKKWMST
jgi:hypothetical protein